MVGGVGLLLVLAGCAPLTSSGAVEHSIPQTMPADPTVPAAHHEIPRTCVRAWPAPDSEREVLARVNTERRRGARCGGTIYRPAPPLRADQRLQCAARLHALDMAASQFFAHDNPRGESPSDRVSRLGYRWSRTGENIAAGQPTPEQVVEAWMNSPGHCKNIMHPDFTELGVGYVAANDRFGHYWAQAFGRRRGASR